jgi:nucleoside 2-deoxyribosyltransferase
MAESKLACFFIAPIGDEGTDIRKQSDMALEYVVRPALANLYEIKRADEDVTPRQISPQLIRDIDEADLIVCDLTGLNANVMYELGVAHTRGKRVIQIADVDTRLPFDLAQSWTVFFDSKDPQSHRKASDDIRRAEERLRNAARISNLVIDSLARVTPEDFRNGTSAYEGLLARVEDLEHRFREESDPVGRTLKQAERALTGVAALHAVADGREQAEAAGQVIDLLAGRAGFERVAVDRSNERRLIVYGDPSLDTSDVEDLIDGFDVEFRLIRRRA